jgi:hypothetical protein
MATRRTRSRASMNACEGTFSPFKEDRQPVKTDCREFKLIDAEKRPAECPAPVKQVQDGLTAHPALGEALPCPTARGAIIEESLIDEAEIEHDSVHALIDQLQGMDTDDEKYTTRFTVLCEYVLHPVTQEEGGMSPQPERARLEWESLAAEMTGRRGELAPAEAAGE